MVLKYTVYYEFKNQILKSTIDFKFWKMFVN